MDHKKYNFDVEVLPMKIERISVHGFKNIYSTKLKFSKILALISLNNFGKSNLLNAIDFGIDFISSESKKSMMRWVPGIPLNNRLADDDFEFELEMTTDDSELGKVWVIYGYQFRWVKNDDSGAHIVKEWLKVKKEDKGQKYAKFIIRDGESAKYKRVDSGRCDYPIKIDQHELVINKLQAFDNLFFAQIIEKINEISVHIERHLDADPAYQPSFLVRSDWDVLQNDALENLKLDSLESLPRAIYYLEQSKDTSDKYELLMNAYQRLFPQIDEIEAVRATLTDDIKNKIPDIVPYKVANEIFALFVTDKNLNQPLNFEYMSDGAKRILLLLTCIILSDYNNLSLVAIEEPENCIHPSLLQHLLDTINQLSDSCRVLITSHSPYLLQYIDLQDIYVGMPSNDGVAQFVSVSPSNRKQLLKNALEEKKSIGEYLFDLMSGSQEDFDELIGYLECDE